MADFKVEKGHIIEEYMCMFGESYENGDLWDFPIEELYDGSIKPQKDMIYWLIKDRAYETTLRLKTRIYYIKIEGYCDTCLSIQKVEANSYEEAEKKAFMQYISEFNACETNEKEYHDFLIEIDKEEEEE